MSDYDISDLDVAPCSPACRHDVVAELQQPGETREAWLVRLGTIARGRKPRKAEIQGRKRVDRPALLALLSADRWTTSAELANRSGLTVGTVRNAIMRARQAGVPIEGHRNVGYRLRREAA